MKFAWVLFETGSVSASGRGDSTEPIRVDGKRAYRRALVEMFDGVLNGLPAVELAKNGHVLSATRPC